MTTSIVVNNISIEITKTADELPPSGLRVIVAGGTAMYKGGIMDGSWFTGMEEPLFERPLEWTPEWWMKIPNHNL